MSKIYFAKELISHRILINGNPVPFEQLGGNRGVLCVDTETQADLADKLSKMCGTLGLYKISAEDYDARKKKWPYSASRNNSTTPEIRPMPRGPARPTPIERVAAQAAGANPPPGQPPAVSPMNSIAPPADARALTMPGPPNLTDGPVDPTAIPTNAGPPDISSLRPQKARIVRKAGPKLAAAAPSGVPAAV